MNYTKDDGGAAFAASGFGPFPNGEMVHGQTGMTLRDYFAASALTGLLANEWQNDFESQYGIRAYAIADAMLQARKQS